MISEGMPPLSGGKTKPASLTAQLAASAMQVEKAFLAGQRAITDSPTEVAASAGLKAALEAGLDREIDTETVCELQALLGLLTEIATDAKAGEDEVEQEHAKLGHLLAHNVLDRGTLAAAMAALSLSGGRPSVDADDVGGGEAMPAAAAEDGDR
jgi:hypothetical protein